MNPMMWPTLARERLLWCAQEPDAEDRALPAEQGRRASPTRGRHLRRQCGMVMLAATLLCLSTKGDGYLPDLHMSVRGATAACKRLAVIAVEDSWFNGAEDRSPTLRALLGLAMATMRMPDYHISLATATKVGRLSTQVVASKRILAWSPKFVRAPTGTVTVTKAHMVRSAELLRTSRALRATCRCSSGAPRSSRPMGHRRDRDAAGAAAPGPHAAAAPDRPARLPRRGSPGPVHAYDAGVGHPARSALPDDLPLRHGLQPAPRHARLGRRQREQPLRPRAV